MPIKTAEQSYSDRKAKSAARQKAQSAAGRDIADGFPAVSNLARKMSCLDSLKRFCETYVPDWFWMGWADTHIAAIERLQKCALDGGQFAFAMPRSSGKTTLSLACALWASLYGHRSFIVVIGAAEKHADELIDSFKEELETNELLLEDFPEVCYPIRCLEGINHRATGQTFNGERTRMEWGGKEARLPVIPQSPASGVVVKIAGITGRIRGMNVRSGRTRIRPDFVIVDDPQTDDSAISLTQNDYRERVLTGAVLGLAGPKKKIAVVMPCTVIAAGDMADRILDRERNPQWHGERTRMVTAFPTDEKLWEEYYRIRREDLYEGGDGRKATAFYKSNRAAMDVGAVVYWSERFEPGELSAVQSAMNLKQDRPKVFWAEFQNCPETDATHESKGLTAELVLSKCNNIPRGVVPKECTRLTLGVDVGLYVLWYSLIAWDEGFGGSVIKYGCWPAQNRAFFSGNDPRPRLQDIYKGTGGNAVIYKGLGDLLEEIAGKSYQQDETGQPVNVDRICVDAGDETDLVRQFCRESAYSSILIPTFGRAVTTGRPYTESPLKEGERPGWHWRYRRPWLTFDPNMWKTFLADRWRTPAAVRGRLSLHGSQPMDHQLFAAHICSEHPTEATINGRTFNIWAKRPNEDNHWLDTVVLGAIGASFQGLKWSPTGEESKPTPAMPRRKLSEIQAEKLARMRGATG